MRKVPLPDGAKLNLYTAALTALAAGAMSNAAHAMVTVANTLQAKAVVVITSEDYPELEGRVARVKAATADSVTLDGVDTSDLTKFPMGGEVSLIPLVANDWQRLPYVPSFALSGGELKTGSSSYLDVEDEQEFSQGRSARRLEYTNSWKQDGAARAALKASDGMESVHRLDFKDGSASYYVGELAYDDTPSTEKGAEMTTKSTVLLRGAPTTLAKAA
ncbi:phage tail tube protein [Comamonas sp. AG1104]|uniref:phage tail tube protein n=1 Tax=Comamonas sp. AG1104 TaxID=2183900 RepID=UPI000E0BD2B7|nr:phage tail tube protein [Comamonas sp. AG1104]RDI10983.1 tail tube protein [Comamonas sp. AG1104]